MIFVSTGTTTFPFPRLLKAIDTTMCQLKPQDKNKELCVQTKTYNYQFIYPHTKVFSELSPAQMINFIKTAEVVVVHGGVSISLLAIQNARNIPIIYPRSNKNREHTDDHQIHWIKYFKNKHDVFVIWPEDIRPEEKLIKYISSPSKNNRMNCIKNTSSILADKLTSITHQWIADPTPTVNSFSNPC